VLVHAQLTDARSKSRIKDWTPAYAPGEERYVPVALAGMVTGAFKLPPLQIRQVNAAGHDDYWHGRWYVRRNSGIDIALTLLERAVAEDSDSPLTHAALAEAQRQKYFALTKDRTWLARAAESVREAQVRDPDLAEVHRIAGRLEYDAGRYENAEAELLRAAFLDQKDSDAHRRLGTVYEARNTPADVDKAFAEYRRAIDLEPEYHTNYVALANFYEKRGDYAAAIEHFQKAVRLAPEELTVHRDLALAYEDNGQLPEAEAELRKTLRVHDSAPTSFSLGVVLMFQRKEAEAIPRITHALDLEPDRYLSWTNLSIAYRRTNRRAEAAQANRRALVLARAAAEANPLDSNAKAFLAFSCAWARERLCAESEIAEARRLSPEDTDVRFWAAATYEALGERPNTLTVLISSPATVIAEVSRWPDIADGLRQDPDFLGLLKSHNID
jgi:tetratricopeptide (TPR) repeat protein